MIKKENDHSAGLIHQTIPDMAGTEPRLNSPCVMDFPTAWAFVREQHPDPKEHDPRCSWVQASGGILCDCHVLNDEYARRKAAMEAK